MTRRARIVIGVGLSLFLALTASVAIATGRLASKPEPPVVDETARQNVVATDESDENYSTSELAEIAAASERERSMLGQYGLTGLYEGAAEELSEPAAPLVIQRVIDDGAVQSLLTSHGRLLVSSESTTTEGTGRFENALYSDGKEVVQLSWQDWPPNVDLQAVLSDGTVVEHEGDLDIALWQQLEDNMIEVGIFDGHILVRTYTVFTEDLTLHEVREIAMKLYAAASSSE